MWKIYFVGIVITLRCTRISRMDWSNLLSYLSAWPPKREEVGVSLLSILFLFSVNIWPHGSVLTKWNQKTDVFQDYFSSTSLMTTDRYWRRDTQTDTSSWEKKVWIICLSVHSYTWRSDQQWLAPHSPSSSCHEEKQWSTEAMWQREGKQQKQFWWQSVNPKEIDLQHCCSLMIFLLQV